MGFWDDIFADDEPEEYDPDEETDELDELTEWLDDFKEEGCRE